MNTFIVIGFLMSIILMCVGSSKDVRDRTRQKMIQSLCQTKIMNWRNYRKYDNQIDKVMFKLKISGLALFILSFSMLLYKTAS